MSSEKTWEIKKIFSKRRKMVFWEIKTLEKEER